MFNKVLLPVEILSPSDLNTAVIQLVHLINSTPDHFFINSEQVYLFLNTPTRI